MLLNPGHFSGPRLEVVLSRYHPVSRQNLSKRKIIDQKEVRNKEISPAWKTKSLENSPSYVLHSTSGHEGSAYAGMITSIVTHPGGAHKDEFLACAVLISKFPVSIFRRDPTEDELADPGVAVVDVGHRHEPDLHNFDHHQFPRDMDPTCSLSLVLQKMGIYEDTKEFCSWLETAEWFDCRGPNDTADWLGVNREAMAKLNSPLDVTLLQRFAKQSEHHSGEPIWEVMKMIGADLVSYVINLRSRMDQVAKVEQVWDLEEGDQGIKAVFVPRTDPSIENASGALAWRVKELELEEEVVAMVYPDSRGEGYGMRRFNDSPVLDFSLLADEPDVHFTHARGFIAKTSCKEVERLKELLHLARA
jgi:hypothetical protein